MTFFVLLAALTAFQGEALKVQYPHVPGLERASIAWDDRDVPLVTDGQRWMTVIGVDLDAPTGEHEAVVTFHFEDGRIERRDETVEVKGRSFPTTRLTVAPKYVELSPEDQARAKREAEETAAVFARLTPEKYWREPFMPPIPEVTSGRNFGHRRVFNDQPRAPHSGVDLTAPTGTEIVASNMGKVVLAHDFFFNGNAVFIDHGLGVYTMYLHLSEILVEPGDLVVRGQVVGLAGATGRVTGPHLHWGARILDARIDPFSLIELETD
jgi:murein DD-endopeptidase MepM/ murein hydrolase activator NlpD